VYVVEIRRFGKIWRKGRFIREYPRRIFVQLVDENTHLAENEQKTPKETNYSGD
jgi:hypothetical protein